MPRPRALARRSTELAALILTLVLLPLTAVAMPVEGYAPYQPQKNCNPTAKPGTLELARWLQRRYPGTGSLGISRACGHGGVSEHKEGRAFDWAVDASSKRDRAHVQDFLSRVLATDKDGNEAALARRMGIMYILWNDHSWASYRGFAKADYRNSSCRKLRKCSKTLRHRDHVHISLSRAGARGDTSWYHRHDPKPPEPAPAPTPTPSPEPTPAPDDPPADAVPARVLDFSERPYARFSVPADGTPVRARLALAAGATYKVTASGLLTYGRPDQVADAACVWTPDGWSARPPAAVRRRHGSLNLTVNGRAVLGTECRSKHTYKTTLTPRRKTGLTLRVANAGPSPKVPGGRIVVLVSRVRTKVAEALPERSQLSPAPKAVEEAPRGYGLLHETVTVRADRPTVTTRQELQEGARYRVTVTGVASLGGGVRTDGRCVEIAGSWFGSAPIDRRRPDQDHGNLYLDGSAFAGRSQGAGCEAHHYVGSHVAARHGRLTLALWDPLVRSDNSGAVTVTLQRLTRLATPTAGSPGKPKKKAKAWRKGREWLEVPVDRAKGVQSTLRFRKGEKVQLVVRGTVRSHGVRADAACVSTPAGWLREDPAVAVRQDPLELWVDGAQVRWRAIGPTSPCSDEHSYTVRHTVAKSGRLRLALLDLDHRDNAGTLRVTLLRQR